MTEDSTQSRTAASEETITRSEEETFEVGRRTGEQLQVGAVFLLSGDLGAGKTVFAKGLAAGLGLDPADVTSPSFTLINLYEGRLRLYHIDLYRLDQGACMDLGLEEILEEESAVTVIEWAERLGFAPENGVHVYIEYLPDEGRRITLSR
ncbi:MAG TPA: tRNA (adenosine(37)-N6)-threonylcarbamoyltransferase complex ATPase subunit type 1 TsaE [Blastocatellia bacterium]|nr:tRNA (adenosine(37)-N6)-threonylcarbamoyltransferase complex ATPase subunit type 1 TsaE [Blastocatellia bacterium]